MLLCEWKEKHSPLTDVFWQPVANFFQGLFTNDMKEKSASIVNIEGIFGDE